MRKIVAVGGVPGTGKTTLFRKFMEDREWEEVKLNDLVYAMKSGDLIVLGKYEEGETFAGTDKLSMAVQPKVQEWLEATPHCKILFEGDRIFNQSFLEFCLNLPDTDLDLVYLKADQKLLEQRYADRGSDQSEKFLRGRETKYNNILSNFELMMVTTEFDNETFEDQQKVLDFIRDKLS